MIRLFKDLLFAWRYKRAVKEAIMLYQGQWLEVLCSLHEWWFEGRTQADHQDACEASSFQEGYKG